MPWQTVRNRTMTTACCSRRLAHRMSSKNIFASFLEREKPSKARLKSIITAMMLNSHDGWDSFSFALGRASKGKNGRQVKDAAQEIVNEVFRQHAKDFELGAPSTDLGPFLVQISKAYSIFAGCELEPSEAMKNLSAHFYDKLFLGCEFSATLPSLPQRRSLASSSAPGETKQIQEWARSCPSIPMDDTFGRLSPIQIGGEAVRATSPMLLGNTYTYNAALTKYLREQGVANPQEAANRCMLLCVAENNPWSYLMSPLYFLQA